MTRRFRVGEWLVEPDLNHIVRGDATTHIEPKVIEVLICLASDPGEVIPKEKIIKTVWPATFVSEEVLTRSISELRRAFCDDAKNPCFIQTIARKGYRLIAPVTEGEKSPDHQPSIAVLAFADVSAEKNQEFFCDGIADEIINRLIHLKGLRVAARTSSFAFKGKSEDIRAIGRTLGVDSVLEGSVRKTGTQLRITAQLISVADGCHLWTERYDRELRDVFAIQDEIAHRIVQALEVELSDTEKRLLRRPATENIEAYEFYLRGRQFFYRSKRSGIECALEMFSHAVSKDPGYALAFAGMADCYSYLYMYFDNDRINLDLAREMSQIALELSPELAEVHSASGLAISLRKEYKQAEEEFQTAIRLNPRLFEAHYFYARTCYAQGRLEEAARLYEQAETVKAEDLQAPSLLAFTCRSLGQKERAEAAYRRTLAKVEKHLELNPDDSRALYLGATALLELGYRDKGLQWARRSYSLDREDPYIVYGIACFFSRFGSIDEAVDYFERAVSAGFTHEEWIKNDSDLDPLRNHPRFQAIIKTLEVRPHERAVP